MLDLRAYRMSYATYTDKDLAPLFLSPLQNWILLSAFIHDNLEHFSVLSAKKAEE